MLSLVSPQAVQPDGLNKKLTERGSSDLWGRAILRGSRLRCSRLELERIGDHATNIAKDSFWRDQAGEIREPTGQRWNPKRYLHYPYPGAFRGIAISKEPAIILRAPRSHLYSNHWRQMENAVRVAMAQELCLGRRNTGRRWIGKGARQKSTSLVRHAHALLSRCFDFVPAHPESLVPPKSKTMRER